MSQQTDSIGLLTRLRKRVGLWRRWRREAASLHAARQALANGPVASRHPTPRLLLVPSDPWTLVGARGDEAMITAAASFYRATQPDFEVHILTATPQASAAARQRGWHPLEAWVGAFDFGTVARQIRDVGPAAVLLLGADVMDGYYSPSVALRLLGVADLCALQGIPTALLGFSFNTQPYPKLAAEFDAAAPALRLNVRDEISLERLKAFTRHSAQLVADAAFHLPPDLSERVQAMRPWLDVQRQAGRLVVGFNAHPMLFKQATPEALARLVQSCAQALQKVQAERDFAVLLVPHDFRGSSGDGVCLQPIHAALQGTMGDRIKLVSDELTAPELKAVAGELDALVTGRMHLAIAALGMGVPVAALTYQDKFQGLFRHFGLPDSLLLAPEQLQGPDALAHMLRGFLADQAKLKQQVGAALPGVKALSARNFVEPKQA